MRKLDWLDRLILVMSQVGSAACLYVWLTTSQPAAFALLCICLVTFTSTMVETFKHRPVEQIAATAINYDERALQYRCWEHQTYFCGCDNSAVTDHMHEYYKVSHNPTAYLIRGSRSAKLIEDEAYIKYAENGQPYTGKKRAAAAGHQRLFGIIGGDAA